MMQPGQVLVRQIIPGLAQPVYRAITLPPGGQVVQQLPAAGQTIPQTVNIQGLPGVRPGLLYQWIFILRYYDFLFRS